MSNYHLPAEWHIQENVWLSWPHNLETWSEQDLPKVEWEFACFVAELSEVVRVQLLVKNDQHADYIRDLLDSFRVDLASVVCHVIPTNDAWIRDYGPDFVCDISKSKKVLINWGYNAWGGKYPPFDSDNSVNHSIVKMYDVMESPDMILEGGSIEVNGEGDLLTTKSCLLNPNRNPHLDKQKIENELKQFLGVEKIHWLSTGIAGDDTDGHIDDFARFLNSDTIVFSYTDDVSHPDFKFYQNLKKELEAICLKSGGKPKLIPLPVPEPLYLDGDILPCSYANFLICNGKILVPTFNSVKDKQAIEVIKNLINFEVVGVPCSNIIKGLGSLHCLSKHEFKNIYSSETIS